MKSTDRRTNVPDVIGVPVIPSGHSRPDAFDGAILGVGPHRLPRGVNY